MKVLSIEFAGYCLPGRINTGYQSKSLISPEPCNELPSFPTGFVLCQMPNVKFSGRCNYCEDDLGTYHGCVEPESPEFEIKNHQISESVQGFPENEYYLSAVKWEIEPAKVARTQRNDDDTLLFEESAGKTYEDLPEYQKCEAESAISEYDYTMADYIGEDVENY